MEKIISLHPDLVFQTADGDLKTFVSRLAAFGIPVYITNPRYVPEILRAVLKIGEATFSSPGARTLEEAMRAKMVETREKVAGRPRLRVLHAMSVDPLISSGKGTFVHDLIVWPGGKTLPRTQRESTPFSAWKRWLPGIPRRFFSPPCFPTSP